MVYSYIYFILFFWYLFIKLKQKTILLDDYVFQGSGNNNKRNTSNTHFSIYCLWLVRIHIAPTKIIWDPHDFVGLMWMLTNQRECVEKCILECVLLAFL